MAISDIRKDYLQTCWSAETEDAYTETWRDELTMEELALVEQWDADYMSQVRDILRAIADAEDAEQMQS